LIAAHYDPAYRRSSRKAVAAAIGEVRLPELDAAAFEQAAREVANLVAGV
jgi:hypothetical protein